MNKAWRQNRIVLFIIGVLMVAGALYSFANHKATPYTLALVVGILCFFEVLNKLWTFWRQHRNKEVPDQEQMAICLVLIFFTLIFLIRPGFAVNAFVPMAAFWFLLEGSLAVVRTRVLRKWPAVAYIHLGLGVLMIFAALLLLFSGRETHLPVPFILGFSLLLGGSAKIVAAVLEGVEKPEPKAVSAETLEAEKQAREAASKNTEQPVAAQPSEAAQTTEAPKPEA